MVSTLKDISVAAGTSVSTASLILNGKQGHRFSKETRDAILRAADRLGYRPQRAAQSLVTGKTRNVALILNGLANPFFGEYASLLQAELMRRGLTAIPFEIPTEEYGPKKRDWLEWIDMRAVDAAIDLQGAMIAEPASRKTYGKFVQHRPLVFREADRAIHVDGCDRVVVDYESGVDQLMAHLAEMGYHELGAILVRGHVPTNKPRRGRKTPHRPPVTDRLLRLSSEHGLSLPFERFRGADHEEADSVDWFRVTIDLLEAHPEIQALVVHNMDAVPAVLRGIDAVGRRVGVDLAIATFDDLPMAKWLGPGITVVGEPAEDVARRLVDLIVRKLKDPTVEDKCEVVSTSLIVRGSTDPSLCNIQRFAGRPAGAGATDRE
ncbi:MAG: LacI family DNA-binding transcriptional regulator [Planctomycetota bacterium]